MDKLGHIARRAALLAPGLLLAACASAPPDQPAGAGPAEPAASAAYPLPGCDSSVGTDPEDRSGSNGATGSTERGPGPGCVARLFASTDAIGRRETADFPPRYLELYREDLRQAFCHQPGRSTREEPALCEQRLRSLATYFNPQGRPADDAIGVALEGGGSKAAPFALGTLAGLHQLGLLGTRTGAIASVSGGSYAASYYFNRLYDRSIQAVDAGTPDDWFRSCIPEAVLLRAPLQALAASPLAMNCRELSGTAAERRNNEFARDYEFVGHVWKNTDLLRGDTPGELSAHDSLRVAEWTNLGGLAAATLVTTPFHLLARSVFRWPVNSAPSKLAYKLGIERAYGYTPHDWLLAGNTDLAHLEETLFNRRKTRTLHRFASLGAHAPQWVIASTAPGDISGVQWLQARPRDPLRQQFELGVGGQGSGTYGYTRLPPAAPFDFLGRNADGLPVLDAVVASAAFFDDDQTQINQQPGRFLAGTLQHFVNVTWFTEMPNYNVADNSRALAKLLPWPLYLGTLDQYSQTPYIHLQDGGNTENTGILPLLRRGYRTIVYAHGTQDQNASWAAICHLKNQLELDGSYFLRSPALEALVADRQRHRYGTRGLQFQSYLDEACSAELDDSDLASYDDNARRPAAGRDAAVSRLFCGRLGQQPGCPEFAERFRGGRFLVETAGPPGGSDPATLFRRWPSRQTLSFIVLADAAPQWMLAEPPLDQRLSTIVAIVPGIDSREVAAQLRTAEGQPVPADWPAWCQARQQDWDHWRVPACLNPQQQLLGSGGDSDRADRALPCTVLAHLVIEACTGQGAAMRPEFPQDDFIVQTLHASYLKYAAYYELARHETRETLCRLWPRLAAAAGGGRPSGCP